MGKIVAIGGGEIGRPKEGGGFYPVETTAIDLEILRLTGKKQPTLLFIPTASHDSTGYYEVVKKHFNSIGFSRTDTLYLTDASLTKDDIETAILSHDAVYVGGGDTLFMMTLWRKLGVDTMLKKAYDKGVVLSGISAGSICWFNNGNSDSRRFTSGSDKLIKVTGLGLINALHCPHHDTEALRPDDLKRIMKSTPGTAIALDNCTALVVEDDMYRVVTSRAGTKAQKAYWKRGQYILEEITPSATPRSLTNLTQK